MKPAAFDYVAPDSLESALHLKRQYGDEMKCLAGGQSLIPAMNFRLAQPARLLDLNRVTGLDYIRTEGDELRLGAMTRQRRLERDPQVAAWAPLLHETMPLVAHSQIRNRGTLGGSLAHADPAAELPVVAVALGARVRVQNAVAGRWVAASDFFKGIFTTDLAPDEVLVEVALPRAKPRTGTAFVELARRQGDYAMAGVAAVMVLDEGGICREARLVYLNLGEGPMNALAAAQSLIGQAPADGAFEAAASWAAEHEIAPMGSVHASPEYQRHLARVLTVRALRAAAKRARVGGISGN